MQSFDEDAMNRLFASRGFRPVLVEKLAPFDVSRHFQFMKRFHTKTFQKFTICPVCGFNQNDELKDELTVRAENAQSERKELRPPLSERFKRVVIPSYKCYRWIAAVYRAQS